ncbi:MAG: amino acid transporter [Desulfobacteraceae bacterium]|nr:amino acid transporter [Desulfobacteraceae bacterium]
MVGSYMQGFGIGAGLIIAIGAQNAFVLSQGIKKQYQWLIPFICSLCDCILIILGAVGIGTLIAKDPSLSRWAGWGGAIFLFVYGARSFLSALRGDSIKNNTTQVTLTLKSVILTTLALTLLNPHVYLDTIVLLGSISSQFNGVKRAVFTLGACSASITWFFLLSFAGTRLRPLFQNSSIWKALDIFIGVTMWAIAFSIWPKG